MGCTNAATAQNGGNIAMADDLVFNVLIRTAALIYLAFASADDLKNRSVRPLWAMILSAAAIIFHLFTHSFPVTEYFLVIGSGIFLFLISFATHSAIGAGDCFVINACSCLLSFSEELSCFAAGLLFCAIWSAVLLLTKKAGRKDTLPFIPFLLGGHAAVFTAELFSTIH